VLPCEFPRSQRRDLGHPEFERDALEADGGGSWGDAAEFGGAGFGVCGGAEQGGFALEDDADGHVDEQLAEAALVSEGLDEGAVLELFEDAGSDAAADVQSADGENLEGQVAGFGAIDGNEHVEGLLADFAFGGEGHFGDNGVAIRGVGDALGEPGWLLHATHFKQELVDIGEAHAADDAFGADAAVVLFFEEAEQVDLILIARGEVGVAALGG